MEQFDSNAAAVDMLASSLRSSVSPRRTSSNSPVRLGLSTSTPRRGPQFLTVSDVEAESRTRRGSGGRSPRSLNSSGHHDDFVLRDLDADVTGPSDLSSSFNLLRDDDVTGASYRSNDLPASFDERRREQVLELEQRAVAARSIGTDVGDRLARHYETQLSRLNECHLEQLENVQIAIKCEISTVMTKFGIKALSDLVKKTNEDLIKDSMEKYVEMSQEAEKVHRAELEDLRLQYEEQIRLLRSQLEQREFDTSKYDTAITYSLMIDQCTQVEVVDERLNDTETDHSLDKSYLEDLHSQQLIETNDRWNTRLQDIELEHERIVKDWRTRLHDMDSEHERTVRDLKAQLHNMEAEYQRTVEDLNLRLLGTDDEHLKVVEDLNTQIRLMKAEHQRNIEQLNSTHSVEMENSLKSTSQRTTEQQSKVIAAEKIEQLITREIVLKTELHQLREKYEFELVDIRRQHLSEMELLGLERDSLIRAVEELRQTVLDKDALLESLREQMASESQKYDLQEQAMSTKINAVMSELEEKKQELLSSVAQNVNNVSLMSTGESDDAISGYQRHLEAMEEIESLQDTVAQQQAEIETLEGDLTARNVELSQLKTKISSLETDIAGLRGSFRMQSGVGDGDDGHVGGKRELDDDNEVAVSRTDQINELDAQLRDRNALVLEIETVVEKLNDRSSSSHEDFNLIEEIRTAVREAIDGRKRNVDNQELSALITEQQQEIEALKLRIVQDEGPSREELQEEIHRLKESLEQDLSRQKYELSNVKQLEIEALEQHWREVVTDQEAQLNLMYRNETDKLNSQHVAEISAKNEEIEQLSMDLLDKADELAKCKTSIDMLSRQLDEHRVSISEGGVSMLQADVDRLTVERDAANQTNAHLMAVLSESVRTTVDIESRINQFLESFNPRPPSRSPSLPQTPRESNSSGLVADRRESVPEEVSRGPAAFSPPRQKPIEESSTLQDTSNASVCSDEGLDVSQRFSEALFVGLHLDSDAEEMVTDLSSRIQRSVGRLIDRLTETGQQIRDIQRVEMNTRHALEGSERLADELRARCDDLEELLKHETESREYLSLEFYKADGLVKGFLAEKQVSEECIHTLENRTELLIQENEKLRSRLQVLEDGQEEVFHREQELEHQREALEQSADSVQLGLLQDNSRLNEELRTVSKQMERERSTMQIEVQRFEHMVEELQSHLERMVEERRVADEDHQQKVDSLEKLLKSEKQFIEFQAAEREQERDEYQQKLSLLESKVKDKDRKEGTNQRLEMQDNDTQTSVGEDQLTLETRLRQIKDLEDMLQEKSESCSNLEAARDRVDVELKLQQSTNCELRDVIRHLETDLDARCKTVRQQEQKIRELENEVIELTESNQQLMEESSAQSNERDDLASLQQTVRDLQEHLDSSIRSERLAQHRIEQLEKEIKNLKTLEEELIQDRDALQKQVCDQLKLVSELKSQVDDLSLTASIGGKSRSNVSDEVSELRSKVLKQNETIELRDREVFELNEQMGQFQERLLDQTEELQHANAQLEVLRRERNSLKVEYEDQLKLVTDERDHLQAQTDELKHRIGATPMSVLTQTLLSEKNEEIDELTSQVERLNAELEDLRRSSKPDEQSTVQSVSTLPAAEPLTSAPSVQLDSGESVSACDNYEQTIESLRDRLQQRDFELYQAQEALHQAEAQNAEWMSLNEMLIEKESTIEQLQTQVTNLLKDMENINESYTTLQDDYSQVEAMAKDKQKDLESMSDELTYLRAQISEKLKYESDIVQLKKELQEKQNVIDEKEEELFELNESFSKQDSDTTSARQTADKLTIELAEKNEQISVLRAEIEFKNSSSVDMASQQLVLLERIAELESVIAHLEEERRHVVDAVDSRTWITEAGHSEDVDDESSISEQAKRLDHAVERNISLSSDLYVDSDLSSDISEPLATILKKLHAESLHILSLTDFQYLQSLDKLASSQSTEAYIDSSVQVTLESNQSDIEIIQQAWNEEKSSLQESVDELHHLNSQATTANQELRAANGQLSAEVHSLTKKMAEMTDQLSLSEAVLNETRSLSDNLHQRLAAEVERSVELRKLLDTERESSAEARSDCATLANKLLEMKKSVSRVENQLQSSVSAVEEQQRKCAHLTDQLSRCKAELVEATQNSGLVELRTADMIQELEKTLSERISERDHLRDAVTSLEQQIQSNEGIIEAVKRQSVNLSTVVSSERAHSQELAITLSDLEAVLESEKARNAQLTTSLTDQEASVASYKAQCEQLMATQTELRSAYEAMQNRLGVRESEISELCSAIDSERAQSNELVASLSEHRAKLESERVESEQLGSLIDDLRANCDVERARNVELQDEVDALHAKLGAEHSQIESLNKLLEEERHRRDQVAVDDDIVSDLRAALDVERSSALELTTRLEQERQQVESAATNKLRSQQGLIDELQQQINKLVSQNHSLQSELVSSQNTISDVQQASVRLQLILDSTRAEDRQLLDEVTRRCDGLEKQLKAERTIVEQLKHSLKENTDKEKIQQIELLKSSTENAQSLIEKKQLESTRQRLCLVAMHLQDQMSGFTSSMQKSETSPVRRHLVAGDVASSDLLVLQRLVSELASLQAELTADWMVNSFEALSSIVPALNDSILRHNAELTNYIEQLSTEKQELRSALSSLQAKTDNKEEKQVESTVNKLVAERTKLAQEHANTARQLQDAIAEVSQLKAEVSRLEFELDREHEMVITQNGGSHTDLSRAKVQRLYTKYLRAESFRKSLIYQKKYLLLLIGGFQDGEDETLAMIARMGAFPSNNNLRSRQLRPLSRFRSAARVIIAISRLKYVSKKWQRASRGIHSVNTGEVVRVSSQRVPPVSSTRSAVLISDQSADVLQHRETGGAHTVSVELRSARSAFSVPSTPPTRDRTMGGESNNRDRLPTNSKSSYTSTNHRQPSGVGDSNESTNGYLRRLEGLQARLGGTTATNASSWTYLRR